nr:MAG TPA: hypothetical protein [Caudoviricetes sp.]
MYLTRQMHDMCMSNRLPYYSPHIFSLRSKDHLIRFNDSYPSIKVLINVEKHDHLLISKVESYR